MLTPASIFFSVERSTQNLGRRLSEMSEISSEKSEAKPQRFCRDDVKKRVRDMIMRIAGHRRFEKRDSVWGFVAHKCGSTPSRVADLYYGEARRIDAEEYLTIEAAANHAALDKQVTTTPAGTH